MVGRRRSGIVMGALFLVAAGCGSSGGGGATTACTQGSGAAKTCIETYSSYAVSGGVAQAKTDCTNGGGVASDTCSHAGADGGCKIAESSGGITASFTSWYYAGNASTEMANCSSGGGVWVMP